MSLLNTLLFLTQIISAFNSILWNNINLSPGSSGYAVGSAVPSIGCFLLICSSLQYYLRSQTVLSLVENTGFYEQYHCEVSKCLGDLLGFKDSQSPYPLSIQVPPKPHSSSVESG